MSFNALVRGNIADRGKLIFNFFFEIGSIEVYMLIQLSSLLIVDVFKLFEESLPFGRVRDGLIVLDKMILFVFSDFVEDRCLALHKIFQL
jgi:hypothetical protein